MGCQKATPEEKRENNRVGGYMPAPQWGNVPVRLCGKGDPGGKKKIAGGGFLESRLPFHPSQGRDGTISTEKGTIEGSEWIGHLVSDPDDRGRT